MPTVRMHENGTSAALRTMTEVSNISDCVFIESIGISPDTEMLRRLGVVELAGEGDELLLLGLLPREGAAAGLGAGGEVDLLEGVVEALRGRVRAGDGRVREHGSDGRSV